MTTVSANKISNELLDAMNPKKASAGSVASEAQDRFMTLLVTQMKNQDPLNPLDNAQVTSQLAQLSTVTGIDKLNSTLEMLMGSYQSSQSLQAANLIGHGVLVPGNGIDVADGAALLGIELTEPAENVQVTIRDGSGREVRRLDVGRQDAGSTTIPWDGMNADGSKAADGRYTFAVEATRGGLKMDAKPLQFGLVATVETGAQGVKLNLPSLGTVNFADVRQIL